MSTTIPVKIKTARSLYNNATEQEKAIIEKLVGTKALAIKKTKPVKKPLTVFDITGIEDVFKRQGKSYATFLKQNKHLSVSTLNYALLEIGIAYLNQGWEWQAGKENYINYWDVSGSGFVLFDGYFTYDYSATVGPALRLENSKKAEFAAKVFYPQYKGYYKPTEV